MKTDLTSHEAEQIVLGSLIAGPSYWTTLSSKVSANDFAWAEHAAIWAAIGDLIEAGAKVDNLTVTHRIGKQHWKLVQAIAQSAIGATNVEKYAEIIKDRATRRSLASIDALRIASESSTAAEAIGKIREQVDQVTASAVQAGPRMIGEIMNDWRDDLVKRRENGGGIKGMTTGIDTLDKRWSGLVGGQMIVIAGRPGNGKTTLAMNIAQHVALAGKSVLVFSFEMHEIELTDKLVSSKSGAYLSGIKVADLQPSEWDSLTDAVAAMRDARLALDTGTSRSIDQIRLTARTHALRYGLDLVVVDYLQQVSANAESRRQEVEAVSRGLKLMALEMRIPVIAISQMSRAVENRAGNRPVMSDLRESGAIEQDADIVAFTHRPELCGEQDCGGIAEIITAKSRHTETGTDFLKADLARSRFLSTDWVPSSKPKSKKGIIAKGASYEPV